MGLCAANLAGGALVYAVGKRSREEKDREGEGE